MLFAGLDKAVYETRRLRLSQALDGGPPLGAIFPAGSPVPRNYAANTYPFRASSHFLYLVGVPIPRAVALVVGGEWTLFVDEPDADHALWHGPTPTFSRIAEATGCRVRGRRELPDAIRGKRVATLGVPSLEARVELEKILGREVRPGALGEDDARLADAIIALRLIHDDAAISEIKTAVSATAAAHLAGMGATRPGATESVVCGAMEAEIIARGMTTAYGSIVTVHGEVLHNESHHHVLGTNDLLLADVGAESPGGFASDVTRTWPVSGAWSTTQRELYAVVLDAQRQAIAAVRPGARYRDVHIAAARTLTRGLVSLGILEGDVEELVADGVHALLFPHGVGHLLGLDVHDMEDLGDRAGYAPGRTRSAELGLRYLRLDRDLEPGMVVTIEPGLYRVPALLDDPARTAIAKGRLVRKVLDRFADVRGIRIEDDVLVTKTGNEVLTAVIPKQPDDVARCIGVTGR